MLDHEKLVNRKLEISNNGFPVRKIAYIRSIEIRYFYHFFTQNFRKYDKIAIE